MTAPGTSIGPYVILGRLGKGGMGEVHLAHDPRLEREVALKMLPADFARDPERMALIRSEALALAAINHPNIATIYGFEEASPGHPMLVLERVHGESLAERLRRGALPVQEALRVAVQVAEALEAAHQRGVIHRDLKPGNVMLAPGGVVKVLDFGLARSAHGGPGSGVTSQSGTRVHSRGDAPPSGTTRGPAVDEEAPTSPYLGSSGSSGTPGYMSPEQVRGDAQDERTDVFAFACVLYEALGARRAFEGPSETETLVAILQRSPEWDALPRAIPARAIELIRRCFEKDAAARPASMREVRFELEEILGIRRASALRAGEEPAPIPNNLPRQPNRFIGRERVIDDCLALHREARLLTVTGVGGSGKTRLALRLAELLLPEFADGVWFVDLAPLTDPARVPQAAAAVVGVREVAGCTITDSMARHASERRLLLVLDNCEHLLPACATLCNALLEASPELRVIATSREALGVREERTYSVPSLGVPSRDDGGDAAAGAEAVQLFADRAAAAARDFVLTAAHLPVVAEICRRLDGIPLAIELAAARVRLLTVEQIREKLHDRFRLLTGGSKAALPRHQTLRATIQWSYDHLSGTEQEFLRSLSVFIGGWTLDAAVSVCGGERDEFEVLDLLARLEDKSLMLVERSGGGEARYRFLETVRQFGRDLAVDRGESDALRRRHRDWFLAFAERAAEHLRGPEQARWLDRIEAEMDNLRAALDWSLDQASEVEPLLRLTAAVNWQWLIRGTMREARERLEGAVERGEGAPPSLALASVLHGAGNACFRFDDFDAARRYYERALAMREQLGEPRAAAGSLGALGNVAQYQGRYADAMALFQRSLEINRQVGYPVWEAANLNCLGNCSRHLGNLEAARRYLEEAVALNRRIGNRGGEATSLDGLACLKLQTGDLDGAEAAFLQALAMEIEVQNLHEEAVTRVGLGRLAITRGRTGEAFEQLATALRILRPLSERLQIAACLEELATLSSRAGRHETAARLWGASNALRDAIGAPRDPEERAACERGLEAARRALPAGQVESALEAGGRAGLDEAIAEGLAPASAFSAAAGA